MTFFQLSMTTESVCELLLASNHKDESCEFFHVSDVDALWSNYDGGIIVSFDLRCLDAGKGNVVAWRVEKVE